MAEPAAPVPTWVRSRAALPGVGHFYGYETADPSPSLHRGLPSAALTFIVSLEQPLQGADAPDRAPQDPGGFSHEVLVGGLHRTPAYVHQPRRQVGVQMAVHPLAARALFGVPASALSDFTHEGREVLGHLVDELRQRVEATTDWTRRMELTSRFLAGRLATHEGAGGVAGAAPRAELRRGWTLLAASGGRMPVGAVAREVGLSARQFTKVWTAEVGAGPKEVARMMRFERAVGCIRARHAAGAAPALGVVAAECGYADQSHLVREFREFAGCSPTQWMAEELRAS